MGDHGLKQGRPDIKALGALAFGPDDVLFVADNVGATITALDVADGGGDGHVGAFDLADLDTKLASFLGCAPDDVVIRDMEVHPRSGNVYLSVMRGRGDDAVPALVRIDHHSGLLTEVALDDVAFSQIAIDNAPATDDERLDVQLDDPGHGDELDLNGRKIYINRVPARTSTVTDMAYVDGELLVAGMSNEEFSSNLRRIAFPFTGEVDDNSLEIFHVSHGKWETAAPIRTFIPFEGGSSILASYTCTPLVHFPLSDLEGGGKAVGRTVAELGNGNQPLDMVSFTQDGDEYLLISHSSHPLMKVATSNIAGQDALTEPKNPLGVPREEIDLRGITKMANLNGDYVLALQRDADGSRHLRSLKSASL